MIKFGIFVDGPTLITALNKIELKVEDFEGFYRVLFERAVQEWGQSFSDRSAPPGCQLYRVFWYQIGSIDRIDLNDPKTQSYYRAQFDADEGLKRLYLPLAASRTTSKSPADIATEAWRLCLQDKREWYNSRLTMLESMRTAPEWRITVAMMSATGAPSRSDMTMGEIGARPQSWPRRLKSSGGAPILSSGTVRCGSVQVDEPSATAPTAMSR